MGPEETKLMGEQRSLYIKMLQILYSSLNHVRVIKSRKPQGKKSLTDLGVHMWANNKKILRETGCEDGLRRAQWQASVITVTNLPVSQQKRIS
jgi:hypothetical protein